MYNWIVWFKILSKTEFTSPNLDLSVGRGPHIRTVPSSEALASMLGSFGFQWTQFTVLVWPSNTAIGNSRRICQIYTLWSKITHKGNILFEETKHILFEETKHYFIWRKKNSAVNIKFHLIKCVINVYLAKPEPLKVLAVIKTGYFYIFFIWVLRPVKIITHFEPSQLLGGVKMGDPGEKTPDHPQAELGMSRMISVFFYLGFTACQGYFTHFEQSQSVGGVKTGDPREKSLTFRKQNLARFTGDPI